MKKRWIAAALLMLAVLPLLSVQAYACGLGKKDNHDGKAPVVEPAE
ncbi:MAG TPA: hypothetical protein VJC08_02035 [bacterium]|nr:hypothetical protein [bacterium]